MYRAVEMAMGSSPPPRTSTQALSRHELLLDNISEIAGEPLNGNDAVAWLTQRGVGSLANRVRNAVRGRNVVAHPDGSLLPDVCQFLRQAREGVSQAQPRWSPRDLMDDRALRGARAGSSPTTVIVPLGDGQGGPDPHDDKITARIESIERSITSLFENHFESTASANRLSETRQREFLERIAAVESSMQKLSLGMANFTKAAEFRLDQFETSRDEYDLVDDGDVSPLEGVQPSACDGALRALDARVRDAEESTLHAKSIADMLERSYEKVVDRIFARCKLLSLRSRT